MLSLLLVNILNNVNYAFASEAEHRLESEVRVASAVNAKKKSTNKGTPIREVASTFDFLSLESTKQFIAHMAATHSFNEDELRRNLNRARHQPDVIRLMNPAPSGFKRSWKVYRERNLDEIRIREGLKFWQENLQALELAEQRFGVPPEIIVAIIGVETVYGRVTGNFRVLDVLTTLAFDYPRREKFFREELEAFLFYVMNKVGILPVYWVRLLGRLATHSSCRGASVVTPSTSAVMAKLILLAHRQTLLVVSPSF